MNKSFPICSHFYQYYFFYFFLFYFFRQTPIRILYKINLHIQKRLQIKNQNYCILVELKNQNSR